MKTISRLILLIAAAASMASCGLGTLNVQRNPSGGFDFRYNLLNQGNERAEAR